MTSSLRMMFWQSAFDHSPCCCIHCKTLERHNEWFPVDETTIRWQLVWLGPDSMQSTCRPIPSAGGICFMQCQDECLMRTFIWERTLGISCFRSSIARSLDQPKWQICSPGEAMAEEKIVRTGVALKREVADNIIVEEQSIHHTVIPIKLNPHG